MSKPFLRAATTAAVIATLGTFVSLARPAVAAPLSWDQALELAVQRSAAVRSARAGTASATEMARAAGQLPDPMLTLGIDNVPASGPDRLSTTAEDMTMRRIGLAQEWVSADKRAARAALGQAMAGREALAQEAAAAEARLQTALAYIDAYYASATFELTSLNEKHANEALEAGRARASTVGGSSAEVLSLVSAVGQAQDESGEAEQQRSAAAAQLQRWTGVAAEPLSPPALPHPSTLPPEPEYVAGHPLVALREREVDVARHELEATRLNRHPNWSYELTYGQRQGRPDLLSFGVNIPLPVAPSARQDRETAARHAQLDRAEAEAEEARRAAAGDYAALASDTRRLQSRIERFKTAVLTPLSQRTATTLAAYRANQASLPMLFEARHAELEAQRKLLLLQRDLAKAHAQLIYKPLIYKPLAAPSAGVAISGATP